MADDRDKALVQFKKAMAWITVGAWEFVSISRQQCHYTPVGGKFFAFFSLYLSFQCVADFADLGIGQMFDANEL